MKKILSFITAIISFAFLANTTMGETFPPAFSDVTSGDTYYHAVDFLKEAGVLNGYSDGTYRPYKTLNRAEFLKIVQKSNLEEGIDPKYGKQTCFTDVPANQWYTEYVCYAKASEMIQGYSDGTFRPNQEVTLVEALKITLKTFFYEYGESTPWYKSVVEESANLNLIPISFTGFDEKVTRGEMADMATRMKKYETEELQEYLELSLGNKANYKVTYETLQTQGGLGDKSYCTQKPIITDIGSAEYPKAPEYENFGGYLGQLLTAGDCRDKTRMNGIFGVSLNDNDEAIFTLGSSLSLGKAPSDKLLEILTDVGYECSESGVADSKCEEWELTDDTALVDDLLKLRPYATEVKSNDCIYCG
ncbi:hypothetical protein COY05_03245 [Candidatus Peregrinibacteria bacterium CG_4_10_14_0_2_um_filter_38_24]|nr:MAG: hypothetical protein COY05_03245 [Candidatus Peregrinibacteria bacterium CG_4_10_14_0_2_um_filter_38_24]